MVGPPLFTEEDIEAHGGWAIRPTSCSWFRPRKSGCGIHAPNHCTNCLSLTGFVEEPERTLRSRRKWRHSDNVISFVGHLIFLKMSDCFWVPLLKSVLLNQIVFFSGLILRVIYHTSGTSFSGFLRWSLKGVSLRTQVSHTWPQRLKLALRPVWGSAIRRGPVSGLVLDTT